LSLLPLVAQLRDLRPDIRILVTSGTRASAAVLATRLPNGAVHQFAPIDTPGAAAGFISYWRPSIGVFVESELWPNLIDAARASGARLALVSARISERSWRNWRRFPGAARDMLNAFDLIFARDAQAGARIADLGGHVDGLWDAKLGAAPLAADEAELATARAQGLALILAASTHPGEEALIARAFATAACGAAHARLIIVPRHANRGAEVEQIIHAEGLTPVRRSQRASLGTAQVYIADTMGELGLWYRLAALAIVSGSFVVGVGGHNPLEPARLGCPFVSGPHVDHWPVYGAFIGASATHLVHDPEELAGLIGRALRGDLADMADRALSLVSRLDAENGALAPRLLDLMAA
jgi:3-deoxy-D-manno-octulosonic-acid transferase